MNNTSTYPAVKLGVVNPAWDDRDSDRLGYDGSGRMITKRYLANGIDGTTKAYNDPEAIVGFTTSPITSCTSGTCTPSKKEQKQ